MIEFKLDDETPVTIYGVRLQESPITTAIVVIGDRGKDAIILHGETFKHPDDTENDVIAIKNAVRNALMIGSDVWRFYSSVHRYEIWHKFRLYIRTAEHIKQSERIIESIRAAIDIDKRELRQMNG